MIYPYEILRYDSQYSKAITFESAVKKWKSIQADGVYALLENGKVIKSKVIKNGMVVEY